MLLSIRHVTEFCYSAPLNGGRMKFRLTPWQGRSQQLKRRELVLDGCKLSSSFRDQFKNGVELVEVDPGCSGIRVEMNSEVETDDDSGLAFADPKEVPMPAFRNPTPKTAAGEAVRSIAERVSGLDFSEPKSMHRLSQLVRSSVTYAVGCTHAQTTAEESASLGSGVCQDHSHIFISVARLLGLPARYVSGYLRLTDRVEQEAMHSWAEVFIDGLGWTGFDISNGISPDKNHVKVAVGRDYSDAAPIFGVVRGGGAETMTVRISIR